MTKESDWALDTNDVARAGSSGRRCVDESNCLAMG